MKRLVPFTLLCFLCFSLAPLLRGQASPIEWKPVEDILGRNGTEQGGSLQVLFPRTDLNVVVKGVPLEPEGLTSWFTFKPTNKGTFLVGEAVLLDTEVPKATAQALKNGLEITALYSPFLDESPAIKRLRVWGKGAKSSLAWAAKLILSSTGTPMGAPVLSVSAANGVTTGIATGESHSSLDWSQTLAILGPGEIKSRTVQFEFPPMESIPGAAMATQEDKDLAVSFVLQKTMRGHVAAMGTFVLADEQAEIVMETLTRHHITVTSFGSRGSKEEPGFSFLSFWVVGGEREVAEGLKDVLDQTGLSEED